MKTTTFECETFQQKQSYTNNGMNNYEGDVKNALEETAAADPVDRQMLAELMQMADSIKWNRPLEKVPLTIDTGENHDFLLKANNSGAGSSSEVEFLLR